MRKEATDETKRFSSKNFSRNSYAHDIRRDMAICIREGNLDQNKLEEIKLFEKTREIRKKDKYTERDLYKVLSYFAYNYMRIYTKTIIHAKSKKKDKGANEWLHPDLVGFYFPLKDWEKQVLELSNNTGSTPIRLYSFEMNGNWKIYSVDI